MEIEADYRRKMLAKKFRQKLKIIQNIEMDEMDLKKGKEIQKQHKKFGFREGIFPVSCFVVSLLVEPSFGRLEGIPPSLDFESIRLVKWQPFLHRCHKYTLVKANFTISS